jgi:tripartite-type tricarboxylate transporter receptor subunit TctC
MLTRRALALSLAALPGLASAQGAAYPTRPVRLIVPFPPGNMSDLIGRVLVEEMQTRHGVTLIMDNRPGATGAIGIQAVTRSAADGYTLLLSSNSPLVVNPAVSRNLPFDVTRDLAPISLVGWTNFTIVVPPDFSARTLSEAFALFRSRPPGTFIAANPGIGTFGHLFTEQLNQVLGLGLEHAPYRGSAQALLDMSQGRVHFMVDAATSALPQIQGGRVRALAILATERSPLMPEVPTLAEAGGADLAALSSVGWAGLLGPSGTPPEVVAWWSRTLNALLADPAFARKLAQQNVEAAPPGEPARLSALIARELPRFQRVANEGRIEVTN